MESSRRPTATGASARWVELDEGRLRLYERGRGVPIVFLHGVSARARSWLPAVEVLVERVADVRCVVPDLLGRGESSANPELRFRLADEVRRLRELVAVALEDPGPPRLVVGHSHGAAIALAYARREPAVRGLVLSNPITRHIRRPLLLSALDAAVVRRGVSHGFAPLHGWIGRAVMKRAGGPHFAVPREIREAYAAPFAERVRSETLLRILADWRPAELDTQMPERALAAHVIAGAHDPRVPVSAARRLADELDGTLTLVDDGGHILPEQKPELLAMRIADLAERVLSADA
ncbi:MAG: alpha/beta hydrolase [Gemmatimonadetes bacterium]|nr:alpha/beta hydrolase [Gemmatimonadota bacterium]